MDLPSPNTTPPGPAPQSLVTQRQDITWGRPIFKAPSLARIAAGEIARAKPAFASTPRFKASVRKRRS